MAVKEERNMRKHLVSAILVVLAGLVFRVSAIEWIFLLQAVFLVIALEIVNSAMENVVDLASNYHFSMLAKNAKDMAHPTQSRRRDGPQQTTHAIPGRSTWGTRDRARHHRNHRPRGRLRSRTRRWHLVLHR